jgi:hypothetical protein
MPNNGTLVGSPTFATGKFANAISLNGTTQYVTLPNGGPQQFAAGSTNVSFAVAFLTAGLQSIFLVSNKNIVIKVNSTSSPILTITLIANQPFRWNTSDPNRSNPFSADVTVFYVSCTPSATLKGNLLRA